MATNTGGGLIGMTTNPIGVAAAPASRRERSGHWPSRAAARQVRRRVRPSGGPSAPARPVGPPGGGVGPVPSRVEGPALSGVEGLAPPVESAIAAAAPTASTVARVDGVQRLAAAQPLLHGAQISGRQPVGPIRRRAAVDHHDHERPVDVAELVADVGLEREARDSCVSAVDRSDATDDTSSSGDCADQPTTRSVSQTKTRPCARSRAASIATNPKAMRQ